MLTVMNLKGRPPKLFAIAMRSLGFGASVFAKILFHALLKGLFC